VSHRSVVSISLAIALSSFGSAAAQESGQHFWSGDWYLSVGVAGFSAPKFEGSSHNEFKFSPLISVGRQGAGPRFASRNDNPSFALIDKGAFRAGIVGRFVPSRDDSDGSEMTQAKMTDASAISGSSGG
jgi:outer membrane protein